MDVLESGYAAFKSWADEAGRATIMQFNPELDYDNRATRGWLMTGLDEALIALAGYSVIVLVGLMLYKTPKPRVKGQKKESVKSIGEMCGRLASPFAVVKAVYNTVQTLLSCWMCVAAVLEAYNQGYNVVCNPFDPTNTRIAFIVWVFYLSKVLDFVDTILIVIGGKWEQFSFLHIYHHMTIFFFYYININAAYDGDIYYTVVANGFVHMVMYFYYLLTVLGIYPWWKKYLTMLQMAQFVTMISQSVYIIYRGAECTDFPQNVIVVYTVYIVSLLVLFQGFFNRTFKGKKSDKKTA